MGPYENPKLAVERRVEDLLTRMTLDEKTCQMGTIYGHARILKDTHPAESWKGRDDARFHHVSLGYKLGFDNDGEGVEVNARSQ